MTTTTVGTTKPGAVTPAGADSGTAELSAVDREFLPSALELLHTPVSPVRTTLIWVLCLGAVFAIGWAYIGKLDIHAVAQGKIQPSGLSKMVQPLEPGKVKEIRVENGSSVKTGDVLVVLDATEFNADREAAFREVEAAGAEAARRRAAIAAARSSTPAAYEATFPDSIDAGVVARERAVLAADLDKLAAERQAIESQLAQRRAEKQRLAMGIEARLKLIAILKERVDARQTLDDLGNGYRGKVMDALQEYESENTRLVEQRGEQIEADAAIASLRHKHTEITSDFVAEQTQRLADAERKGDMVRQELVKANAKRARSEIKAPIDGTVQELAVTTIGQVVSGGQQLMAIVPADAPLEVEAMILNKDIGLVEASQEAAVKIDAFPFTRYGTIDGRVVSISREGIDLAASAPGKDVQSRTHDKRPNQANVMFPAKITLARSSIEAAGKQVPLSPGMTVTVEVKTGQRRVIDYILSPLNQVGSEALHER